LDSGTADVCVELVASAVSLVTGAIEKFAAEAATSLSDLPFGS
jgi:hypothetical protein